jgi:hypothetical protein
MDAYQNLINGDNHFGLQLMHIFAQLIQKQRSFLSTAISTPLASLPLPERMR